MHACINFACIHALYIIIYVVVCACILYYAFVLIIFIMEALVLRLLTIYPPDTVLKATPTVLLTMVTCDCFLHIAVRVAS